MAKQSGVDYLRIRNLTDELARKGEISGGEKELKFIEQNIDALYKRMLLGQAPTVKMAKDEAKILDREDNVKVEFCTYTLRLKR